MNYYERIAYDACTGAFTWAVAGRGIAIGKPAGAITSHGYRVIKLGRRPYRAARLAWFLVHGAWPDGEIDHINGVRLDDRIANLRVVDRAGNSQNRWRAHRDHGTCGLMGVTWNKQHKRWQAKIVAHKVRHHLGYFADPTDGHKAYIEAKKCLHIKGGNH